MRRMPGTRWTGTWFIARFLFLVGYKLSRMHCALLHPWFPEIKLCDMENQMDRRVWTGLE
jgi:hypothetical protein